MPIARRRKPESIGAVFSSARWTVWQWCCPRQRIRQKRRQGRQPQLVLTHHDGVARLQVVKDHLRPHLSRQPPALVRQLLGKAQVEGVLVRQALAILEAREVRAGRVSQAARAVLRQRPRVSLERRG